MLAEIAHIGPVERRLLKQVAGRLREEDLSVVCSAPDALGTADAQAPVPGVRGGCFRRADADPEGGDAPRRLLNADRGCHSIPRASECDEDGIVVRPHVEAAVLPHDGLHQISRLAGDLREQERDDAGRLGRHLQMSRRREGVRSHELGVVVQDLLLEPL